MTIRVYCFCFSLITSFLGSMPILQAQINTQSLHKDSLLNELTDVNKRIKDLSAKDLTKGYILKNLPESRYQSNLISLSDSQLRDANGLLHVAESWIPFANDVSFIDTVIFEPAYLPVIFDGKILPSKLDFISSSNNDEIGLYHLINPDSTFAPKLKRVREIREMRKYYYQNNPRNIEANALNYKNSPAINEYIVEKKNVFQDLLSTDDPISFSTPGVEGIRIKPVYWIINGDHSLQVSQNQFSDKWGGGNNTNFFKLVSNHKISFNYKKKKIAFNNLIDWRLNVQNNEADKLHKISLTEDLFRTYTTFGIDAFKNWSYSSNLEMKTPLFNRFDINEHTKNRAFMSPFELNLGIGMRYNLEKKFKADKYRKLKLGADLSALSLNYRFVSNSQVNETAFGIEEGSKSKTDYGSTVNISLSYDRNRFTTFASRLKYFTNYEKVYTEWENTANFSLNRYFSTTIYLYLKYDDSIPLDMKDNKIGYFSYNEILAFGLTYKW